MEEVFSYDVTCSCGRLQRGQRKSSGQIISCPGCGRRRFILPKSPWLAPAAAPAGQTARVYLFRLLLVIVLGGATTMVLIFVLARPYLRRPTAAEGLSLPGDCRSLLADGERQLREGNLFLALKELNAALEQYGRQPQALSRAEHHQLVQLQRQTDLLAHLLDRPLEDIAQQAMQHRNDEEWNEKFRNYRGRSVVFDDVLRRDAESRPSLATYVVRVGDREARVALEDLILLRQLPIDPPRRWLFGARLANCRREGGGIWVFRFDPESGVLLSDESAAAACCPQPLDAELLDVLKRQDEWLRR